MQSILSLLLCSSNVTSERESRQNIELHFNTQLMCGITQPYFVLLVNMLHAHIHLHTYDHTTTLEFIWSHVPGRPDKCKYSLFGSVLFLTNY